MSMTERQRSALTHRPSSLRKYDIANVCVWEDHGLKTETLLEGEGDGKLDGWFLQSKDCDKGESIFQI